MIQGIKKRLNEVKRLKKKSKCEVKHNSLMQSTTLDRRIEIYVNIIVTAKYLSNLNKII